MSTTLIRHERIEPLPSETGRPLPTGRHIHHDSRSLAYEYDSSHVRKLVSVIHERRLPIFDQGTLGDCVSNAGSGDLATEPCASHLPPGHALTEITTKWIQDRYHECTVADPYKGTWPPDDTGTDGLTYAKVMTKLHPWLAGFQHTFTTDDALAALQDFPFMFGTNWYDSMDTPDANGVVSVAANAYVRGGHEILFREYDSSTGLLWFDNSWSTAWGRLGRAGMTIGTFDRLVHESGDVIILMPLAVPTPPPVPTPTPAPEDVEMWAAAQKWAKIKGLLT